MDNKTSSQTHIRIYDKNLKIINQVKQEKGFKHNSTAINTIIEEYGKQNNTINELNKIHKDLLLQRKYLNEIRRHNFLILYLLNNITYEQNISGSSNFRNDEWQSSAFRTAKKHLKDFMSEVTTKISENDKNIEEQGDFISE